MASRSIVEVQQALKSRGFDLGAIDGVWSRRTIAAVKNFQKQQGLAEDGIVGSRISAVLFASTALKPLPNAAILHWLEGAKHLVGTKEILGFRSNPKIYDWAKDLDIQYSGDISGQLRIEMRLWA